MDLKERICGILNISQNMSDKAIERAMSIRLGMTARGDVAYPVPEELIEAYNEYAKQEGLKSTSVLLEEAKALDKSLKSKEEEKDIDLTSPFIDDSFYKGTPRKSNYFDVIESKQLREDPLPSDYTVKDPNRELPKPTGKKKMQRKSLEGRMHNFINTPLGKVTIFVAGGTILVAGAFAIVDIMINGKKTNTPVEKPSAVQTLYDFKYEVEPGDTYSGLVSRFDATRIDTNGHGTDLYQGEVVTIYTKDASLANEGKELYEEVQNAKEPTSFDYYTVQPGDTIGELVKELNTTRDLLQEYNPGKVDGNTIYAGDTLRIPRWEKENVKG